MRNGKASREGASKTLKDPTPEDLKLDLSKSPNVNGGSLASLYPNALMSASSNNLQTRKSSISKSTDSILSLQPCDMNASFRLGHGSLLDSSMQKNQGHPSGLNSSFRLPPAHLSSFRGEVPKSDESLGPLLENAVCLEEIMSQESLLEESGIQPLPVIQPLTRIPHHISFRDRDDPYFKAKHITFKKRAGKHTLKRITDLDEENEAVLSVFKSADAFRAFKERYHDPPPEEIPKDVS